MSTSNFVICNLHRTWKLLQLFEKSLNYEKVFVSSPNEMMVSNKVTPAPGETARSV